MAKLRFDSVVVLASSEARRTVTLSAASFAILLSQIPDLYTVFRTSEMTDEDKDIADAWIAQAQFELTRNAMLNTVIHNLTPPELAPDNWIPCMSNNHFETMADWPELMAVYPAAFKNVPTAGQFYVPNFIGRFLTGGGGNSDYGFNFPVLSAGGQREVTLTLAQIPSHNHSEVSATSVLINGGLEAPANSAVPTPTVTGNAGSGQPHDNMPPWGSTYVYLIGR